MTRRRRQRARRRHEKAPPPRGWRAPALLALAAFLVYCANARYIGANDTLSTELVPVALLTRGSLDLAEFERATSGAPGTSGFAVVTRWGSLPGYPIATGLALTPFYALPVALRAEARPTTEEWLAFARTAGKTAAAALAALSAAVFLLLARELGASRGVALGLGAAYAFGSSAWSVSSQALWQHGPSALLLLAMGLLASRQDAGPTPRRALALGLLGGLAVAVRLTNVLFVAPLAAWLLLRRRGHALLLLAPIAALTLAVAGYNGAAFGHPFGLYSPGEMRTPLAAGLAGVFLSPGRGLLVYFPLALLGFAGAAVCLRRGAPCRPLWLPLALFVLLHSLVVARFATWWGGACYGPRLMTEVQPALLLLAVPLFAAPLVRRRALLAAAAALLLVWCVFVQAVGAFLYTGAWDATPEFVDRAPERLWDWADNPIERELTADRMHWVVFRPRELRDFRAEYDAPPRARAPAGATFELPVRLRNSGEERWLPYGKANGVWAVHLCYRLAPLAAAAERREGERTRLPEIVSPGEEVAVPLRVTAPAAPGEYLLEVSLVQEVVDWFDSRGSPAAVVRLTVTAPRDAE